MAKKTWDEEIDKTVDWGGDTSTSGLPVQGNRVQEFIKNTLESKIGYIVRDESTNYYYCFADKTNADKYYEDPETYASLLLATFDAPVTKMVNLELKSPSSNVILKGATNNIVKVEFETVNAEGETITENHTVTYTITRSGYKKVITQSKTAAETTAELNIDSYLEVGVSNVTILVTGNDTKASSTVSAIYNCVNLSIVDTYNIATVNDGTTVSIPFTINGTAGVPKTVYWYINGTKQPTVQSDIFTQAEASSTKSFSISNLSQGVHNIQYRVGMTVDGVEFYTPTYFRDFIVYKNIESSPLIAISNEIPTGYEPLTGETYKNPTIYGLTQYISSNLTFGIYNKDIASTNANIYLNDELIKECVTVNGVSNTESITPTTTGSNVVSIIAQNEYGTAVTSANSIVSASEMDFGEDNDNLRLNLRALGKNNQSDKNKWEFESGLDGKTYKTTFSGFSWNNNSGWYDNSLIIANGTSIDVDITPLKTIDGKDVKYNGFTFEMEFSTANVMDDDAVICDLTSEDGKGILITATGIKLSAHAEGVEVSAKFKSGENIRIAFVINKYVESANNFAYLYINGVLCGAVSYGTAGFIVDKTLHIGSDEAVVKVKQLRIYNKPLTAQEIVNNYILYRENGVDMMSLYRKNKIYENGSISVDAVQETLPVFIITGDLQKLENFTTEDKSTIVVMPEVQFINTLDPKTSFRVVNAHMSCQGTSSMAYPIKNLRLYTKKKSKKESDPTPVVYDLEGKEISSKISFKSCESGTPYAGDKKPQPVNTWCIKADYAESSSSHNTGVARIWNDVMTNTVVDDKRVCATRAQRAAENSGYSYDVRTTVDGYPCVIFSRQTENDPLVYMGKYNFNNDKSTESVFGFCDIPGVDYIAYKYEESSIEEYTGASESDRNETSWEGYKKDIPEDWSTVCPKAYEFSKTYQKVKTSILDEPTWNADYYYKKVLTSQSTENKVYCVEMLNNDSPLGQYIGKPEDFTGWTEAFEFRYPEGENDADTNGGLTHLQDFFNWCCSTRHATDTEYGDNLTISGEVKSDSDKMYHKDETYASNGTYIDNAVNRQKKFQREKWDYLDVYKMAAYYIYLMRFGAVDQVVKNAMFTTEGTVAWVYDKENAKCVEKTGTHCKWFYINYDNDTILGLNNAGALVFDPDIDRQSNVSGIYSYAGHESTLWNNLEADDEFMAIVRAVDDGLSQYGLKYDEMITMFDDNQATKWCERLLNNDSQIKYLDTFTKQNNLTMLQGPRSSHRKWWISKRFALYDSKFISGDYAKKYILIRSNGGTGVGTKFYVTPSERMYYGYGTISDGPVKTGVEGYPGSAITFETMSDYQIGSQVVIYAGPYISKVDVSNLEHVNISSEKAGELDTFDLSEAYSETLGSQLKEVILGKTGTTNVTLETISGLKYAPNLEKLNVIGYEKLSTIDLSNNAYIKELNASKSGLANLTLPNGTIIEEIYLPNTIAELKFIGAPNIKLENIHFDDEIESYKSINIIDIENSQYLNGNDSYMMVMKWLNNKSESSYNQCHLTLEGINWTKFTMNDVDKLSKFKEKCPNVSIKGTIDMANRVQGSTIETTIANINKVKALFGENCFSSESEVYVKIQTIIVLKSDNTEIVAGKANQFSYDIYPYLPASATITYSITSGSRDGVVIDSTTGNLTSEENVVGEDSTFTIQVKCEEQGVLTPSTSEMSFKVLEPTYPTHGSISGTTGLYKNSEYNYTLKLFTSSEIEPIGSYTIEWSLTGDGVSYVSGWTGDGKSVIIKTSDNQPEPSAFMRLSAVVTPHNNAAFTVIYDLLALNEEVIMTTYTNPVVMALAYQQGWAHQESVMTKTEAKSVSGFGTTFRTCTTTDFKFPEIKYFTNVLELEDYAFCGSKLQELTLPANIQKIGKYAFGECKSLETINIDTYTGDTIPEGCFVGDVKIKTMTLPSSITGINDYSFAGTSIKYISDTSGEHDDEKLIIPSSLNKIQSNAFTYPSNGTTYSNNLVSIKIVSGMTLCGDNVIRGNYIKEYIVDENNATYGTDSSALYDKSFITLLKYASANEDKDSYEVKTTCTKIAAYAFSNVKLKNVKINASLTNIDDYCFYNNTTLEEVDMSECSNLEKLPQYCFAKNNALNNISLPNDGKITTLGYRCFSECTALKDLVIPESVTTLESIKEGSSSYDYCYTFAKCSALTSLTLSNSITGVNRYMITECSSLEEIVLPKHMKVGSECFSIVNSCGSLKKITLPILDDQNYNTASISECPSLTEFILNSEDSGTTSSIYDGCLYNANKTKLVKVPFGKTSIDYYSGITSIGVESFKDCNKFEDINIPTGVTSIGERAFNHSSIKTLNLHEGFTTINSSTFSSCNNLRSIKLPTTITSIGNLAFQADSNVTSITAYMVTAPKNDSKYSPFNNFGIKGSKLYIPKNSSGYTDTKPWSDPLLNSTTGCGFTCEIIEHDAKTIYVKIMDGETVYTAGTPYIGTTPGDKQDDTFKFDLSNVQENDTLDILENDGGVKIAEVTIKYYTNDYTVSKINTELNMPLMAMASPKTVSKVEYDLLNAKVKQLEAKIEKIINGTSD